MSNVAQTFATLSGTRAAMLADVLAGASEISRTNSVKLTQDFSGRGRGIDDNCPP